MIRYRCLRNLGTGLFHVQSADTYRMPIDPAILRQHESQFLELLIEEAPSARSTGYSSLEQAIAAHDRDFENGT